MCKIATLELSDSEMKHYDGGGTYPIHDLFIASLRLLGQVTGRYVESFLSVKREEISEFRQSSHILTNDSGAESWQGKSRYG